jgi:8-oxo-dGTP diphosphatase
MKNHEMVNGRLIQTNKRFSQLKQRQKLKIHEWLYEAYVDVEFGKIKKYDVVSAVYKKIEDAEIWIPYGEVDTYYSAHKNQFRKRYEKAQERMTGTGEEE